MLYSQIKLEEKRRVEIREINKEREDRVQVVNKTFEQDRDALLRVAKERNIYEWKVIRVSLSKLAFGSNLRGQVQARICAEISEWIEDNCNGDVFLFVYEKADDYLEECADDDEGDVGGRALLVYFSDESDAAIFKLAWC
jgi:hypothetical protein